MSRTSLAALVLVASAAMPAHARDLGEYQQSLQASCGGDYIRFCAGIDPNGKEVEACFKRNMDKISPECRTAITGYQGRSAK